MTALYDLMIITLGLSAGISAIWYWRNAPRSQVFSFRLGILINICFFMTIRTIAAASGIIHAPTFFFSTWGALIFAQVIFTIVYAARK